MRFGFMGECCVLREHQERMAVRSGQPTERLDSYGILGFYPTDVGPEGHALNGFSAESGDFVGVLVTATGEADDQDLAGPQSPRFLESLGHRVAGLKGG